MHFYELISALHRNIELQEKILLKLDVLCSHGNYADEQTDQAPDLMDYAQIQFLLKISKSTLHRWKKDGLITPQKIGKKNFVSLREAKMVSTAQSAYHRATPPWAQNTKRS